MGGKKKKKKEKRKREKIDISRKECRINRMTERTGNGKEKKKGEAYRDSS